MIKWLWNKIWGVCNHKWKIIVHGPITRNDKVYGTYYNLQCEKCGDVKVKCLSV